MIASMRLAALGLGMMGLTLASGCGRRTEADVAPIEPSTLMAHPPMTRPTCPTKPSENAAPPEVAHPYDEAADAAATIDAALAAARGDRKSVLLVFGANWCPWCRRLEHTLTHHREVAAELARNFHVVHVDTGARGTGKNAAVASRYGDPTRLGLPVLVVLTPDGQLKATQDTGALELGDRHDPAAILAFLMRMRS